MIETLTYEASHEKKLIALLKKDSDWDSFTNDSIIHDFKKSLLHSVTQVCFVDGTLCGYIRAVDDPFGLYVSELYVGPDFRNKGCGWSLLNNLKQTYSGRHVYVLSDEDAYYEKKGLAKIGSVFEL